MSLIDDDLNMLIHRYLMGEMEEDEIASFEKRIESDTALKAEVDLARKILSSISLLNPKLKADMDRFYEEINYKQTNKIKLFMKNSSRLWIAASVLLFIAAIYLFRSKSSITGDELVTKFYKAESIQADKILNAIGSPGFANPYPSNDTLKLAMQLYKEGKFKNAIPEFNKFISTYPDHKIANLYMGICQFNNSNYAEAIKYLNPLAIDQGFEQRDDAIWNLAFCYLKAENGRKDALSYMQKLDRNDSPYQKDARGVIDLIK